MTRGVSPSPGTQSKTWRKSLVDDLKSVSSHGGVNGTPLVGAWSRDRAVVTCSKEGGQVVPGGSRSSRTLHGKVA